MKAEKVKVISKQGLHARPAGQLVKECKKFKSQIRIRYGEKGANAKSIYAILQSGIRCGSEVTVECEGEDEEIACDTIVQKIAEGLGDI